MDNPTMKGGKCPDVGAIFHWFLKFASGFHQNLCSLGVSCMVSSCLEKCVTNTLDGTIRGDVRNSNVHEQTHISPKFSFF